MAGTESVEIALDLKLRAIATRGAERSCNFGFATTCILGATLYTLFSVLAEMAYSAEEYTRTEGPSRERGTRVMEARFPEGSRSADAISPSLVESMGNSTASLT